MPLVSIQLARCNNYPWLMDSGGRCRSRKNSRVDSLKVIFTEHRNRTDQPRLTKLGARQEPGLQEVLRCPSFKPVLEISRVPKTMYYGIPRSFAAIPAVRRSLETLHTSILCLRNSWRKNQMVNGFPSTPKRTSCALRPSS